MGALTNYANRLNKTKQETEVPLPKKKKVVPKPTPTPPTAIPNDAEMQKRIEGFRKKGWIK